MAPPNILLVVVDQLRFDCVGFAERYPVRTPHIDRFASEGTWFSSAYTPIPTCCPARQSFLTGKRAESLGTLWNYDLGPKIPAIDPSHWSWTQAFADAGYAMSYVGKWHVSPRHDPRSFGFATYVSESDYESFRQGRYPDLEYRNGYFGEDDPLPLEDTRTHWLAGRSMDEIRRHAKSKQPWLVRLDLSEPHLPCQPAKPFSDLFGPGDVPQWTSFRETFADKPYIQRQQLVTWRIEDYEWADWAPIVARYYNTIAQVDDAFGRLLSVLEESGAGEDTVVIFTSDHGDMCGGHRMIDKHYVLYDDVVHVPLIVRMPGRRNGNRCDDFVYNMLDLPPTLLEAAGLEVPDGLHGRSLMPVLRGGTDAAPRQSVIATYNGQQFGLYSQRMLRQRDWKYIWNATDVDELYDLRHDPDELVNLAGRQAQASRLAEMRRTLYEELIACDDSLVANQWLKDQLLNSRKIGPITTARSNSP
ncbi:sulfatase-like hydrolase/transferase [Chelativorans sp. AA-79]|uniref:sulfatase-like hydrolase/transferase n=1 Tax=Chelativorans sp. AA-79 TaxID=3028735 RepID=UPI0023F9F4B0|nr:sulfatase-like hydrolase/transferase [Chelativorans sp. AA-79]WEX10960.1 sulfatase-like hydrolase/transferase [Chelativorans sp. AA-79]